MADAAEKADQTPKAPHGGRDRGGQMWLVEIGDPEKWVAECAKDKLPQVWVKLRQTFGQLFCMEAGLVSSLVEEAAKQACRLLGQYATLGERMDENVVECASVLHQHILSLYDYEQVQKEVANCLVRLVAGDCLPTGAVMTNLLMWCVYAASDTAAAKEDAARLFAIKHGLDKVAWEDERAREFVQQVMDLINPTFMALPKAVDILARVVAQNAFMTRQFHRRFLVGAVNASKTHSKAVKVYGEAFVGVWSRLEGLSLAVFEQEAVKPFLHFAIHAEPSVYYCFKEVLLTFRMKMAAPSGVKAREGFQRLLSQSEVLNMLDAPNQLMRRNVVGLLGDHFPICEVGVSKATKDGLVTEQVALLTRALCDPNPLVRQQAVSSFGRVLAEHWELLDKAAVLPSLDYMCKTMAYDRSDTGIRIAVLKALKTDLLPSEHCRPVLANLLPTFTHVHETSTKARQLYTSLLLDTTNWPDMYDRRDVLIDPSALVERLAYEKNKQVVENVIKYLVLRSEYWFAPAKKEEKEKKEKKKAAKSGKKGETDAGVDEPAGADTDAAPTLPGDGAAEAEAEMRRVVKSMLMIVTGFSGAAVPLYRGLVRLTPVSPAQVVNVVTQALRWCIGARAATQDQVQNVLAVLVGMTQELWGGTLAKKAKGRAELATALNEALLIDVEVICPTYVCKQLTNKLRAIAAKCRGASADITSLIEAFRSYTAPPEEEPAPSAPASPTATPAATPTKSQKSGRKAAKKKATVAMKEKPAPPPVVTEGLKLLLHRLLAEGGAAAVMQIVYGWVSQADTKERGLACVVEVLQTDEGRATLLTDDSWGRIVEVLLQSMEGVTKALRSPMAKEITHDEAYQMAHQQEVLCRVATARAAERFFADPANTAAGYAAGQKAKKDSDEAQASAEADDLVKVAHVMVNSVLPAAKRARRQGAQLPAVLMAEQVIVFLTRAVEAYQLITRRGVAPAFKQSFHGEETLDMVIAACPWLAPRVFHFICTALEMQALHLVLPSWSEYVMKLITNATHACDALNPVSADPDAVGDNEEHREKAWAYLADHGIYRYSVEELTARVLRTSRAPQDFIMALWKLVTEEVGGFSVAPFVLAEACTRLARPLRLFLDAVGDLLSRTHAAGNDLAPHAASGIAMTFAALLAAKSRTLTTQLVKVKEDVLDPFFKAYAVFCAPADSGPSQGDLFGSQDSAAGPVSEFTRLGAMLDALDWSVPLPRAAGLGGASQAATSVRHRSQANTNADFDELASRMASQPADHEERVEEDDAASLDADSDDEPAAPQRKSLPPRKSVDITARPPATPPAAPGSGRKRKAGVAEDDAAKKKAKNAVAAP